MSDETAQTIRDANDLKARQEIARLLAQRCNNCYSKLPGYHVHGAGWHWLTPNIGPFCDDCWTQIEWAIGRPSPAPPQP